MRKVIGFLVLMMFSGLAAAATASAVVQWTNPTTGPDGTPLTGTNAITKYQIWFSTAPLTTLPLTPTAEIPAAVPLQTSATFSANSGDTVYAVMKVCNVNGCSVASGQASGVVPYPPVVPGPAQSVTIKITLP